MNNESVVGLIKDLTAKLSAVAEEFNDRASHAVSLGAPPTDGIITDALLRDQARVLMAQRRLRREYLPAELFHEPAWDMLLALFVAGYDDQPLNIKALVATADAPVTTSQRWVEHLYKLHLINRVIDPTDRRRVEISLNDRGHDAVRRYLTAISAG